ncbi:MAG: hypothetical protein V1724_00965, partial [Chloroflexota bacterium]
MAAVWTVVAFGGGLALGALLMWLMSHVRSTTVKVELSTKLAAAEDKLVELRRTQEETRQQLSDTF